MHKNLDPHVNILWLSDIHYHNDYKDKTYHTVLGEYLESFKEYLKNFTEGFDYILLSGDIAQNGETNDYDAFGKDILAPIQTQFPEAQLLVIPGNHDVSRGNTGFISEYVEGEISQSEFFKEKKTDFLKIFGPYSAYFLKQKIASNASSGYKKKMLYGHVIDKKNNLIIVMLNSAWYSFGYTFLNDYIKNGFDKIDSKELKNSILKITAEYGKQILALEILDEVSAITKILKKYPEYLVITTLHHPVSWLGKDDQITSKGNKFHKIKKHTDLMLTGHEHVHPQHPFEYLNNNNTLHLKAGCFAEFSGYRKENVNIGENSLKPFIIDDNWFSTLRINTKKRTVGHCKHIYDSTAKNWLDSAIGYNLHQLNKKHKVKISQKRLNALKQSLHINPLNFVGRLFPGIKPINADGIYPLGNDAVIFLPDDKVSFPADKIKSYFSAGGENRLYVVLVDLYNEKSKRYVSENNRLIVANEIKNDYDFKFNGFRHVFFSKLTPQEVPLYGNLTFISTLIPFWELEC